MVHDHIPYKTAYITHTLTPHRAMPTHLPFRMVPMVLAHSSLPSLPAFLVCSCAETYQSAAASRIIFPLTTTWFHPVLVWQCWFGHESTKQPCGVVGSTTTEIASMNWFGRRKDEGRMYKPILVMIEIASMTGSGLGTEHDHQNIRRRYHGRC